MVSDEKGLSKAVLICLHCYYFRIDPTNACRVVIVVSSYSIVEDDRSVYKKGRRLDWWVDAEEYSITDMEKDVFKHLASYQEVNFWFVGQNNRTVQHLCTDQEFLALLRASRVVEFIMTVDRCQHLDMALTVTEMENGRQVPDEENDLQMQVIEMFQGMHVSVELNGLE
jgi:hypothetical protein